MNESTFTKSIECIQSQVHELYAIGTSPGKYDRVYIFFIHIKVVLRVTFYCMISENGILSCGRPILKYVLPFDPCKHIQGFSQTKTFSFN